MGDWSTAQDFNRITVSFVSTECLGGEMLACGGGASSVVAWPSANEAFFLPFVCSQPITIDEMMWYSSTASGNVDAGVYDNQGNLIVSTGSTVMAGSGVIQSVSVSATINPGVYYLALACDNTTAIFNRVTVPVAVAGGFGVLKMASAFVLPATATFAANDQAYIPLVALSGRTVV